MNDQQLPLAEGDNSTAGGETRRISVLEALADAARGVGPSRSNQSTVSAGDADDQ
ncbi:hypothetical protein ABZU53_11165 [Micromonospora sp. NPDC005194]|uniref:hypothetical protein n=1 Tax=Micromonospora sp. NPDC005194 TaxID=3156870 RepID=UPI0033AE1CB4